MKRITAFALGAMSLLGLIKIFSIIPFNRLAADDFSYMLVAKNEGFWTAQKIWYQTWTGRFSSTFFQTLFGLMSGDTGKIALFSALTFTGLIFALIIFYKRFLNLKFSEVILYILASATFVLLYVLTPNKSETWYWLTGSVTYLWPLIFFILASSYLFIKKPSRLDVFLAALTVFISVGGNETFGFLTIIFLLGMFLLGLFKRKINKLTLSMLIVSGTALFIDFLSPGNLNRSQGDASNPMNIFGSAMYALQSGPSYYFSIISNNMSILLPMIIVFGYIFSSLNKNTPTENEIDGFFNNIFLISGASVVMSAFYMFPAYKILGRIQPDRSDISLILILTASFVAISYYLSKIFSVEKFGRTLLYKFVIFVASISIFVASFGLLKTLAGDIYIVRNYSQAYDSMILAFKEAAANGDKGDVVVSLPYSGLVAVTLDPPGHYDYKNQALGGYFGIGKVISQ